jgi:hypothetical protein
MGINVARDRVVRVLGDRTGRGAAGVAVVTAMEQRACDVCTLVDGDSAAKEVGYCSRCNAWMCAACRRDPVRRAKAAGKKAFGSMMRGLRGE